MEEYSWVGKQLGKYKILKLLGCGGMGAAYQAVNTLLEKIVCLKILFPGVIHSNSKAVERFLREAKSIARLEHPNIVQIYDIEQDQDLYFIVMEYIRGKTLAHLMEDRDAFSVRETILVGREVAGALGAAHERNIIHRDVKPANIMVDKDIIKLTDFGLARFVDSSGGISSTNEVLGTPLYLAPEYIRGEELDIRVDIYSLGVTLFHMVVGQPPYTGNNPVQILERHLNEPVPPVRQLRPDIPAELAEVIQKAMAKDRRDRYADTGALIQALDQCATRISLEQTQRTIAITPDDIAYLRNSATRRWTKPEISSEDTVSVLVVDDSAMMCKAISRLLQDSPDLKVVGMSRDGAEALKLIGELDPDVITLDYNMPEMDGASMLREIMVRYPRPVIMLSAFTYEGALTTLECLSCGAVDFLWKTSLSRKTEFQKDLIDKVRNAAGMELSMPKKPKISKSREICGKSPEMPPIPAREIAVIGAGEGGYHTCLKVIPYLQKNISCAVVLIQEMPDNLVETFTRFLDQHSRVRVKQIQDAETLHQGVCYVANHVMPVFIECCPDNGGYLVKTGGDECVAKNAFATVLTSAAGQCGSNAIGIALTGGNREVVEGLKALKSCGGTVLVQKPATCLRPDVAREVIQQGFFDKVVSDIDIPSVLWHFLKKKADSVTARLVQRPESATRELVAVERTAEDVAVVSAALSAEKLRENLDKYRVIFFTTLAGLTEHLKNYPARVILDGDYLGNAVIEYVDTLKRKFPGNDLFVLLDETGDEIEPALLSLPYAKNETRLAQLLSPYLYLDKFRFKARQWNLKAILLLAQKLRWSGNVHVNQEGVVVFQDGKVVDARHGELRGRAAVEFQIKNGHDWQLGQGGPKLQPEKSLLIVENNERYQKLLSQILASEDYRITIARDGVEAIFYMGKEQFDLVISEIDVPNLDGFKLLEMRNKQGIKTPWIFLTIRSSREDEILGLQAGAVDYIVKPFDRETLLMRIRNAFPKSEHKPVVG